MTDMAEAWQAWGELPEHNPPPPVRDPDLPPLVPSESYWVNHPDLHRRANPIPAVAVGPDPFEADHWILVSDKARWASRVFSLSIEDIGDQEGLTADYASPDERKP